jgi:hypothetical protein
MWCFFPLSWELTIPVSTVWGTEDEVLENHDNPVPEYDFASEDRFVE